jgi:hypothetical protein
VELYLYSRNTPSWRGAQLGGEQGQLYLLPYYLRIFNNLRKITEVLIRMSLNRIRSRGKVSMG